MKKYRCDWCGDDPDYVRYHDREWGVPIHSDKKLFEMLTLEGAQAGLSWITVLKKRQAYRHAFERFDFNKIAGFSDQDIERLLQNPGIIRNRLKIKSTVKNARAFIEVRRDFKTFNNFIWSFVDYSPIQNQWNTLDEVPARTIMSDKISKELKARGFSFIGSTICYAYMQSIGMVNDHLVSCYRYKELCNIE